VGDEPFDKPTQEAPRRRWRGVFTWTGLAAAGFVIFELTHQPALGAVALSLKFAFEDFKTARWLYRYDPWRARGRACWWAYVAWGLWKAVVAAFGIVVVAFGFLAVFGDPFGVALPQRVMALAGGAALTISASLGLSSVATVWAVVLAARHKVRLWVDESVKFARRDRLWPPYGQSPRPPVNRLAALENTTFLYFCLIVITLATRPRGGANWISTAICVGALPVALLWIWLAHSVRANAPGECWHPDEVAAGADDPLD
jgi:hypothetical protein